MMSSDGTSSPVSASTFWYLIRLPVFLLIWLKLIFSDSEVAGNNAIGQVTRESRRKPFQLARGAMNQNSTKCTERTQYRRLDQLVESRFSTPGKYHRPSA